MLFTGLAGVCLALAACDGKQPGEDAAAIVNGYEITTAELNHELAERGVSDNQDPAIRSAALEAIINRKLLANMAEDSQLDRTPDFILREQRMRELLLSQAAIDSLAPQTERSNSEDVATFLKDNLAQGSERTIYAVDALQFPTPRDPQVMQRLQTANTFEAVTNILRQENISTKAARLNWDSAAMPSDLVRQLNGLPASEPFLIPQENIVVAGVVRDKRSMPLDADQSRSLAETAVAQQTVRKRVTDWLEQARFGAKVTYGAGFGPGGDTNEEAATEVVNEAPAENATT